MNNVFEIDNGILVKYHGEDNEVVIPDGVTRIHYEAFNKNLYLHSIDFPASVESIGPMAFWGCRNLLSINLPDSLKTIERLAFADCRFCDIVLPNGLTAVEHDVFSNTHSLDEITIYGETFAIEDIIYEYNWSEIAREFDIDEDEICNLTIFIHDLLVGDLLQLLINGNFDELYMPEKLRYEFIANVLKHKPANINFLKMAKEHITELTPYLRNNPEIIQHLNESV